MNILVSGVIGGWSPVKWLLLIRSQSVTTITNGVIETIQQWVGVWKKQQQKSFDCLQVFQFLSFRCQFELLILCFYIANTWNFQRYSERYSCTLLFNNKFLGRSDILILITVSCAPKIDLRLSFAERTVNFGFLTVGVWKCFLQLQQQEEHFSNQKYTYLGTPTCLPRQLKVSSFLTSLLND